jgi:lipoprotein NlpI
MTAFTRLVVLAACLVLPACASSGTNAATKEEPTTLVIDNQSVLDHTVYVIRGSQRLRVGTATGLGKTHLTIPRGIVFGLTTLRFMADPIGSNRTPVSEEITVNQGDELTLRIPPV